MSTSNRIPLLFDYAFRPFFLLVSLYAVVIISVWGLFLAGVLPWPSPVSAFIGHGHEMVFGFAGGAIAGFLLTAVATWTGRPPVSGRLLMLLCAFWVTARAAAVMPGRMGSSLWAIGSLLFWLGLCVLMAREVCAARNTRNYKVPALLLAFLATETAFFVAGPERGEIQAGCLRAGLFLVLAMVSLVGGRIVPAFTQNWLHANRPEMAIQLAAFDRLDQGAVALMALLGSAWVVAPNAAMTGWLGLLAAAGHAARLLRWRGWRAAREPLVWILHVGYGWMPIGFALLGFASLGLGGFRDAGLHALAYGVLGTMILGVAARVALGHTGRPLTAVPVMRWAFVLITLGAASRVLAVFGTGWLWLSIVLWLVAYGLFLARYTPILLQPRVDGKR